MKSVQVIALSALGGVALAGAALGGYMLNQRSNDGPQAPSSAEQPVADQSTEEAPAELAGAAWVQGDCSSGSSTYEFENGRTIDFMGFPEAERRAVRYQKYENGWKVIRPDETHIYSYQNGNLKFEGFEIAGELIRTPQSPVLKRCPKATFEKIVDVPPASIKEPLRYALFTAITMKDAQAAERIVARMPSVEGGINAGGDPDKKPDIDTMLSTATREIYLIVQKKRGKSTGSKPEDSYASNGTPWQTVSTFPEMIQGEFIVPDRVGGCSNPFMTIRPSSFSRNVFGKIFENEPARIAVSGNRVWIERKTDDGRFDGGNVLEIQPDGSLVEIANLTPSGAPVPTSGTVRYLRCSAQPASADRAASAETGDLANAKAAYARSTDAITAAWQALSPERRQALLPSQRAWIRQKMTDCKNLAARTPGAADQKEAARLQCEVGLDRLRVQQLKTI
ncbi:MAG: DUF1311 domain-containing protein [Sphingomonas sp.]|nr:DUF1311 domain-containing protein [Sphingomonas sp.]